MIMKTLQLHYTNCFLLRHDTGWLLIDTGYAWEKAEFLKGLSGQGVLPREITHLFLTHAHDDHAGLLNSLIAAQPQLSLIMSGEAAARLPGGRNVVEKGAGYITRRIRFLANMKARFDKRWDHTFPSCTPRPSDRLVTAATSLDKLGINLPGTLIPTPGHTKDSLSLLLDNGDCFCGDAAANFFWFAGTRKCVVWVSDLTEYYRSWDRLLDAGAQRMYPSHGKPFPAKALAAQKGRHKRLFA